MENKIYQFQGQNFSPGLLPKFKSSFSEAFNAIVNQIPQAQALSVFENNQEVHKSFQQLNDDIVKAQNKIQSVAGDSEIICTIGFNTYQHVVFILATLLIQKTLFPLNPNENDEYFSMQTGKLKKKCFIFHDARIKTKLGSAEAFSLECESKSITFTENKWSSDYIYVCTSGSTGHSKIVRQSEQAVMTNCAALSEFHNLSPGLKIATCMPIFHVNALEFSLFCSLLTGGHLLLFEETSMHLLPKKVRDFKADIVSLNPQILRILAKNKEFISVYFNCIRYFVSAASALSTELAALIWSESKKKVIQGYGMSEAVNFSCLLPPDISDEDYLEIMLQQKIPTIGTELWGNSVFVLDDNSVSLGSEQTGELAITGFNVMSGYLDSPGPQDYLRTGDIGYYKIHKGKKFFFIERRIKDVAKRMGETIPLRELDDLILSYAHDFDCISVAFPHQVCGEELGLICNSSEISEDHLKIMLARLLSIPFYKRPKVIIFSKDAVLRTASGKPIRWKHIEKFKDYSAGVFSTQQILTVYL